MKVDESVVDCPTQLICNGFGYSFVELAVRAGPQSQKWSDQQITLNPTGSIHKKAREKKFDPKKVDFDEGVSI